MGEDMAMTHEAPTHEHLVRLAAAGDMTAFVELMRRFQHSAFGSALTLVRDFQRAEDVVQEAFVAAWTALPTLSDPAAFPGWLRGIVRHHAFRVLRRKQAPAQPLTDAHDIPSDEPGPERQVEQRQRAAAALAAIAELPDALREPATLFFVHECSHQDIATFLNLSVATVNNRLHAARSHLKERMLTMVTETLQSHRLPDDFANRIGRLIEARGNVVEVLFDPAATPDILAELAVSDEANRRAINIQVVQRPSPGVVRGVATSSADALPRGSTVLSSGRHAQTPIAAAEFEGIVRSLAGRASVSEPAFLETGIKVIDVMCPLVAGGTLAIVGDWGAGMAVVMEELVRRLSGGDERLAMFMMMPPPSADWPSSLQLGHSRAEQFKEDGFSEGTVGAVQTFFLQADVGPWTDERLAALAPVDVVLRLSRDRAKAKVYPTVDVSASRSRLLDAAAVGDEHAAIAARARQALAALWSGGKPTSNADRLTRERALKLQNYFTQPFALAEPYTGLPGATVGAKEALTTCGDILDGRYDDLPADAFYFSGGISDIETNLGRQLKFGPVIAPTIDA
jgi:RNA polymerase sigma factor (sigma-70 family)